MKSSLFIPENKVNGKEMIKEMIRQLWNESLRGRFAPAAESHGLWPWMNAPTFGRDVTPLGR